MMRTVFPFIQYPVSREAPIQDLALFDELMPVKEFSPCS